MSTENERDADVVELGVEKPWPRLQGIFEQLWPIVDEYTDGDIGDLEFAARVESVFRAPSASGEPSEEAGALVAVGVVNDQVVGLCIEDGNGWRYPLTPGMQFTIDAKTVARAASHEGERGGEAVATPEREEPE